MCFNHHADINVPFTTSSTGFSVRFGWENKPKELDLTKPLQTRDGRKARILSIGGKSIIGDVRQPLVMEIEDINGDFDLGYYCNNGGFYPDRQTNHDIINVPEEKIENICIGEYFLTRSGDVAKVYNINHDRISNEVVRLFWVNGENKNLEFGCHLNGVFHYGESGADLLRKLSQEEINALK